MAVSKFVSLIALMVLGVAGCAKKEDTAASQTPSPAAAKAPAAPASADADKYSGAMPGGGPPK